MFERWFQYFWMEGIDLPDGIGFGLFTAEHFGAVAACLAGIVVFLRAFLKRSAQRQNRWLRITAVLLLLGNLARDVFLLVRGRMSVAYLPFHLCSFAIFVYLLYAFLPERYSACAGTCVKQSRSRFREEQEERAVKQQSRFREEQEERAVKQQSRFREEQEERAVKQQSRFREEQEEKVVIQQSRFRQALGEIGCVLLLPGTLIALLLPDWSTYPLLNFMCIHSFLWHAVLAAFPLALLMSGRVHPTIRHIWYPVVYLAVLVPPTLWFDRRFDVNFLFINWPLPNTPLMTVYHLWGRHWLIGYALLVFSVILAEYIMVEIIRKIKAATWE